MIEIRQYWTKDEKSPFEDWFDSLDAMAAQKVSIALARIENGNSSNIKGVGSSVLEYKISFGPGYRIYFGKDGEKLVILLGGGTKKRQQKDIDNAKACWQDYKSRKK